MIFNYKGTIKIHIEVEQGTTIPNVPCIDLNNDMTVTIGELFCSIIACGTVPIQYLPTSTFERIRELEFKRSLMDFVLSVENGYLVWDKNRINEVDQSERNTFRYYVGMWMTWVVANKLYGIDFLCHYKRFRKETNCSFERNKKMANIGHLSEPDFIGLKKSVGGCNSSEGNISPIDLEYYVFEAKGGRGRNGTTFDKAINKQLPVVRSIDGKYPKSYVLGYSVCEAEYISSGVTVHNLLKIIVAESNQNRHDAYDIVLGASISTPMYLFEKFVTDLYEEVGELKKFQEFAKTDDRSVSLFNDIDITDASVENEIILNIKYDKMRSIDVILERRTGVVSVVERRDVSDSGSSKSIVSIIDLNENQVYVTPPDMTDK